MKQKRLNSDCLKYARQSSRAGLPASFQRVEYVRVWHDSGIVLGELHMIESVDIFDECDHGATARDAGTAIHIHRLLGRSFMESRNEFDNLLRVLF